MKSNSLYHVPLQRTVKPFALVALAVCSWADVTLAQDAAAPAAPADPAAAPAAPVPTVPAADATTPAAPTTADKPSSPFRTGEATTGGTAKKSPFAYDNGDTDAPAKKTKPKFTPQEEDSDKPAQPKTGGGDDAESRIVAPSFYGRGPQVITPGQGIYARPKFRFGISAGIGYDDNPNQTPTANLSAVATKRTSTGFNYVNGHWDAQWLKPRTVFTLNLEAAGDFYWNRPGGSSDANVRLGMLYVNKIDQRTQFTANAGFAYLSNPDYSNLYASTRQSGGDYFTGSTKFDLSHQWERHFSTVTSVSVNLLKYVNDSTANLSNSYWTFIFGNEFRFQSSRRLTWIAEGRYEIDQYISNTALNSNTAYALGGMDWIASRNLTATFRTGASFRSYDSGGSNSAPYAEISLNYLMARHSTLTLNGRYGYEQSSAAGDDNLSYRFGLIYQQAFNSRFSGNASFNFIHTDYSPRTGSKSNTDIFDLNIGCQYRLDRHFSLAARYSYTLQDSSTGLQNFDRNRVLFTAQYEY